MMESLTLTDKAHDEQRQGEAFAPFAVEPNVFKKKFYIESYGCAMNFSDSQGMDRATTVGALAAADAVC